MIFLWYDSKIFQNMTLRTFYIFSKKMTQKNWFFWKLPEELNIFYNDSKNWTHFSWMGLWELNSFNVTQRCCSLYMTRKIEFFKYDTKIWTFFWMWFKEFFQKKKKTKHWTLWKYDSKNWTWFWKTMTHWIEPFFFILTHRIEPFFSTWHDQRIEPFLFNMTQRIESFIFFNMTHSIEPFFSTLTHWIWTMTHRIEPLFI